LNFILIGIPDSGKTTLGKKAADALGMRFYDTDIEVADHILANNAKPSFLHFSREFLLAEEAVVGRIAQEAANAIIATGAEAALSEKNVQALRRSGRFIYIKRDPDRMIKEMQERVVPNSKEPAARKADTLRMSLYREVMSEYERLADLVVENDDGEEAGLEKLIKTIQAEMDRGKP
jgi:shikimate kinase